jgi:hypothetical protein
MQFQVTPIRNQGKLCSRWQWSGRAVIGDLYVTEEKDEELSRTIRVANILDPKSFAPILPPLLDPVLIAVKPDWWTLSGWERQADGHSAKAQAFAQSWILIPVDKL